MPENLSEETKCLLEVAEKEAKELGCAQVETSHLLLALILDKGRIGEILKSVGATEQAAREYLAQEKRSGKSQWKSEEPKPDADFEDGVEVRAGVQASSGGAGAHFAEHRCRARRRRVPCLELPRSQREGDEEPVACPFARGLKGSFKNFRYSQRKPARRGISSRPLVVNYASDGQLDHRHPLELDPHY